MANFTNQLAEVNKTLERMESLLQISKTIKNALVKCITSLEKQCWRNEWHECEEIVGVPDSTNETKVCELIEKVTSINENQNC